MTISGLGKSLKKLHPQYADVPDDVLGRKLIDKHPDFFGNVQPDDMDSGTIPETPKTLAIQLQQLQEGIRRVVFIARGSGTKVNAADYGMRRLTLPSGDFIYDPHAIKPQEIIAAVKNHSLNEILGSTDKAYGAPPKEELQGEPMAVVSRDTGGETVQGALTDQEHLPDTVDAAQDVTPDGGGISVESPEKEIEHRKKAGRWPKPSGKVKLPEGETRK